MSAIVPPLPPTLLPASNAGGAGMLAVAAADAKLLGEVASGALLEAAVLAPPAKGVLNVQTANGQLQLKLPSMPALQPDAGNLLMQVVKQNNDILLKLVAVNGKVLAGPPLDPAVLAKPGNVLLPNSTLPGLLAPKPDAAPPQPAILQTQLAPQATTGLTATIIRPAQTPNLQTQMQAPEPGQAGGLPPDLPAGTRITVRIAGIGDQAAPLPNATPAAPAATPQPVPAQPNAPQPQAQAQTPAQPQMQPATSPPPVLTGTVTAHPPGGHAVVRTPIGTLSLPTHADLPVGTTLTMEVVDRPLPPPAAAPPPPRPQGLTQAGWPALQDATAALAGDAPALDQLMRHIPHDGPRLAASLAAFAGALRGGDVKAILGESVVKGLEKAGKKETAEKLKADMEELAEEGARPMGDGNWRVLTLPFLHGTQVDPIHLFVRQASGNDQGQAGGTGNDQRFVLDFNLSRLGRLQLDGLVRRDDKLFDLIVRTGEPLSPDMRRDILAIFTNAAELVGTKGSVSFQAGGRWIELPPVPSGPSTHLMA